MGVAADLGYRFRRPNPAQRLVQRFASTRPGAWVFSRTARHLDDVVGRLTRGRTSAPEIVAGLPVLDVTTTGRRSGQRRTSHLIAVPIGDTLALLGTNFGQRNTPAWALNLEADPRASVTHRGRTLEVVARPATEDEHAAVLAGSAAVYGGYLKYQARIAHRRLRIFVLERGRSGPA
jgi:deazaflavin-dependent oxidoreductase (nitroreductase family)